MFQKSGSGTNAAIPGGGVGGKKRLNSCINLYTVDINSPSTSVSLPPLLDSSASTADRESCSYDVVDGGISTTKEHVPCFSTSAGFNDHQSSLYDVLPPHPPLLQLSSPAPAGTLASLLESSASSSSSSRFARAGSGISGFPSLRSLQDNLHLPSFFSNALPPLTAWASPVISNDSAAAHYGGSLTSATNWAMPENQKTTCPAELDCMWGV